MKGFKRILAAALVAMLIFTVPGAPAMAEENTAGNETQPDPLYIYKYDGQRWNNGIRDLESSYRLAFKWMRTSADGTTTEWEKWRTYPVGSGIFRLDRTDGTEKSFAAYCCDFIVSAQAGALYKRINLEDSSYFTASAAKHIRGIMNNGYWTDWTSEDLAAAEAAANQWIASEKENKTLETGVFLPGDVFDAVEPISGLTEDQAMTATQLAIWAFANTESDGFWMKFRPYVEGAAENDPLYLDNNIKAFRNYLLGQLGQPSSPESILFTDEIISEKAVLTSGDMAYDVTVRFRLAAAPDVEKDNLTLTASMGEHMSEYALTGEGRLMPDSEGYYTIIFRGVRESGTVNLELTGTQSVNDVYFYEAQPAGNDDARDASQNLVGFAEDMTPVRASSEIDFVPGTGSVSLVKYDAENQHPLAGAEFALYAYDGKVFHPACEGLITDSDGRITVSGLAEGYEYFFREINPPEGYEEGDGKYIAAVLYSSNDTEPEPVTVYNTKKEIPVIPVTPVIPVYPVIPWEPDPPVIPEEPVTPEEPVVPEDPAVPEQPEMPESTGPEASDEEEQPLTSVPKTGDMGILPHLLIMAGAVSGLILMKKRTS